MGSSRKNVVVVSVGQWVRIEADFGPLVPIGVAARLWAVSKQAVWDRVRRGTLPVVRCFGQAFVPLDERSSSRASDAEVISELDRQ